MGTPGGLTGRRSCSSAVQIKVILFSVCRPTFLKVMYFVGGGDPESGQGQDHGANTDVRRRARANVSTVPAPENRRADVPLGSNSLKHRIQILS
jgi:hypothetical protein